MFSPEPVPVLVADAGYLAAGLLVQVRLVDPLNQVEEAQPERFDFLRARQLCPVLFDTIPCRYHDGPGRLASVGEEDQP